MAARKITALEVQKRNPRRVNVYLDGEFAFGLARIVAAWLSVGMELSEDKIAQLRADDEREIAFQQALRLINYRPRTRAEIRTNLEKHKISPAAIDEILTRLEETGLVDDARFAAQWVENRSEFRPRSRRLLYIELRQHGLETETIEQTLEEVDEEALALKAAQKHALKLAALDHATFRQKLTSYLCRRGFQYQTSADASEIVWNELTDSERLPDHKTGKVE